MCLRALPINEYVEKLRGFTTSYSTYSLSYRLPLPLRLNEFCEITSKCDGGWEDFEGQKSEYSAINR